MSRQAGRRKDPRRTGYEISEPGEPITAEDLLDFTADWPEMYALEIGPDKDRDLIRRLNAVGAQWVSIPAPAGRWSFMADRPFSV